MPTPRERDLQTPCGWCGNPIAQPPTGRRLRYCDRSCRQRAYEVRTAQRRLQRDVDAGVVRTAPAERVVERVVQPRHPSTPAAWATALEELAAQLSDGRIAWWHYDRLRAATDAVTAALERLPTGPAPAPRRPVPGPPAAAADARVAQLLARLAATSAGSPAPTTLLRIAGELAVDVDDVRAVLAMLVDAGVAAATRPHHVGGTTPVDARTVAEHARFTVDLHPSAIRHSHQC
ncbi:hypothetical protein [Catenuloplanes indicus]|uniref:Uncharacterized protein n=1 Tax=Catenuloplanes indicus TaxID=137267 RepID=A0AAE4AYI1_9ACTN|nr:hypothetical protein [Catenuloplanes indicus]MDQ0365073.1 hypothetical protein [Catenuloplanes indicus]